MSNLKSLFKKYFYYKIFVFLLALIILSHFLVANKKYQPFTPPALKAEMDAIFDQAMLEVKQNKYKKSLETLGLIKIRLPNHPAGYLYSAAVMQWITQEFRNFDFEEEFYKNIDLTLEKAEEMHRKNPWRYIYLGGAYGFRGIQESENGNFFSAFHDGLRGYNRINTALDLDSSIYDAYYGIGTYIFWKSYFLDQFIFLSGNKHDKVIGIKYMYDCLDKCFYTKETAENSLIRVLYVDGRLEEALEFAKNIFKRDPNNISVKRHVGLIKYDQKKHRESTAVHQEIKDFLLGHPLTKPDALIEVNYNLALNYYALKDYKKVKELYLESETNYFDKSNEKIEFLVKQVKLFKELYQKTQS